MHTRYSGSMNKKHDSQQEDITKQKYKGPSVASAVAGEGFIAHITMGITGLVVGAAAAFMMPKQVLKIEETIAKFHLNNKSAKNLPVKWLAQGSGHVLSGISYMTDHVLAKPKVWLEAKMGHGANSANADRFKAMVFGAGTLSAFGYFVFPWMLGPQGARKGIEGKQQFETAKEEIVDLRKRLIDKDAEIDDLKTVTAAKKGTLKVASDEPTTHTSHTEMLGTKPKANWAADIQSQNEAKAESQLGL